MDGGKFDDVQRYLTPEHEQLAQQIACHRTRIAQQRLDHLQRRRAGDIPHESALAMPYFDELEVLEAFQGLAERGAVDAQRGRQIALVGQTAARRIRTGKNPRLDLLEDSFGTADGPKRLQVDSHRVCPPWIVRSQWSEVRGPTTLFLYHERSIWTTELWGF